MAKFSGIVNCNDLAASFTWPTQLPPGWTVEWNLSSDVEVAIIDIMVGFTMIFCIDE